MLTQTFLKFLRDNLRIEYPTFSLQLINTVIMTMNIQKNLINFTDNSDIRGFQSILHQNDVIYQITANKNNRAESVIARWDIVVV